jgi:iron complex outermembrane receptor protein
VIANWRLELDNVTDERYWANVTPSGQSGYKGAGNGTSTLGAPRTLRASLELEF